MELPTVRKDNVESRRKRWKSGLFFEWESFLSLCKCKLSTTAILINDFNLIIKIGFFFHQYHIYNKPCWRADSFFIIPTFISSPCVEILRVVISDYRHIFTGKLWLGKAPHLAGHLCDVRGDSCLPSCFQFLLPLIKSKLWKTRYIYIYIYI